MRKSFIELWKVEIFSQTLNLFLADFHGVFDWLRPLCIALRVIDEHFLGERKVILVVDENLRFLQHRVGHALHQSEVRHFLAAGLLRFADQAWIEQSEVDVAAELWNFDNPTWPRCAVRGDLQAFEHELLDRFTCNWLVELDAVLAEVTEHAALETVKLLDEPFSSSRFKLTNCKSSFDDWIPCWVDHTETRVHEGDRCVVHLLTPHQLVVRQQALYSALLFVTSFWLANVFTGVCQVIVK